MTNEQILTVMDLAKRDDIQWVGITNHGYMCSVSVVSNKRKRESIFEIVKAIFPMEFELRHEHYFGVKKGLSVFVSSVDSLGGGEKEC